MQNSTLFALTALVALLPAALMSYRPGWQRDGLFWSLTAVALAGPLAWAWAQFAPGWRTGLAPALWASIAVTVAGFAVLAAGLRTARHLAVLLFPYLILLGVVATVWQDQPGRPLAGGAPGAWFLFHIAASVSSYAILTLAAIAGLAAFIQDRALKAKRSSALGALLPPLADSEFHELRLLAVCAAFMAFGLITGMAVQYFETGALLTFDHKTLLSLLTFAVIAVLLYARHRSGLRGRRAARLVLLAWLLLTLGYPGVKFVTDVLMA